VRRFSLLGLVIAAGGITLLSRAVANVPIGGRAGLESGDRTAREG
jgi:hypothetical protein